MPDNQYDVFLSHNSKDKDFVEDIADALKEEFSINVWIDNWRFVGGANWYQEMATALHSSRSCAVFLGGHRWGNVHEIETLMALARNKQDPNFRVIPILLRGIHKEDQEKKSVSELFKNNHWVNFQNGSHDREALYRLAVAIKGNGIPYPDGRPRISAYRIKKDAERWANSNRNDKSILYTGKQLEIAEQMKHTATDLSLLAKEFLTISRQEQKRRTERQITALIAALVLISAGFIASLYFGDQARQQRNVAQQQTRISNARAFAAQSTAQLETDPERSLLLAMEAISSTRSFGEPPVPQAIDAVHQALEKSQVRMTLKGHDSIVLDATYSPDERSIATASQDGTAKIWDTQTGHVLHTLVGHRYDLYDAVFSPDSTRLATVGDDGTVRVWSRQSGQELLVLEGAQSHQNVVRGVAYSPDGEQIATVSHDGKNRIRLWNAQTGKPIQTIDGHTDAIFSVAYSPDSKSLITASADTTAKIWDAQTGAERMTLTGHTDRVISAAYSPDGQTIATSSWDQTIKLWDAQTG